MRVKGSLSVADAQDQHHSVLITKSTGEQDIWHK